MTSLAAALEQARRGRLYPSVILYGGAAEGRQRAALELARALLCDREAGDPRGRGCDPGDPDACRHCRRLLWPAAGAERFHPDLHVLERDLRTSTSIDATKAFARQAVSSPFEAGGQVFIVAEAETLSAGAADALLKLLEEPPTRSPRHFLLLAASRHDLSTTLRSRSLALFLGAPEQIEDAETETLLETIGPHLDNFFATPSALHLLLAAGALSEAAGKGAFSDPRARRPWALGATALVRYAARPLESRRRRALLSLAEDLLDAPRLRLRGIPHSRILDGLVARRLADV